MIDAYCGIGTIGIVASQEADRVIGVELNRDAVRDAAQNATTMYLWVKYTTASRVYIHLVAKAVRIESAMG